MAQLATVCSLLPASTGAAAAPEWLHLIPPGEFRGADGRGPWRLADPAAVIAASRPPLVLDECHSTDLALKDGREAPARGWIVDLQARSGAIWGRVEWTPKGRAQMEAREYRGVSPVFAYAKGTGEVLQLLRAGLTNAPNLPQLAAINSAMPEAAAALVDDAIRAGAPVAALREHYVARARLDFDAVRKELEALRAAAAAAGEPDAGERRVVALLGLSPAAFLAEKRRLGRGFGRG